VYWLHIQTFSAPSDAARLGAELARIEAAKFAKAASFTDASLWQMSRNPVLVAAGRSTFNTTCALCHLASLRGKEENPLAIGPNLTDQIWIHGGRPLEIYDTVTKGVLAKGMPTWGPVLGPQRISEVVAYVLSYATRHRRRKPTAPSRARPR
jgi:cytochrome c oxidase cbb3-type subunit 3